MREIGEKCLDFRINERHYLATFVQFSKNVITMQLILKNGHALTLLLSGNATSETDTVHHANLFGRLSEKNQLVEHNPTNKKVSPEADKTEKKNKTGPLKGNFNVSIVSCISHFYLQGQLHLGLNGGHMKVFQVGHQ